MLFDNNNINGISIEEEFLDLNNNSDKSNNNSDNSNNDSEKENLENSKSNTNETDKTDSIETREENIKMEFNNENFKIKGEKSLNNKIIEFDLIPFIFTEEYKNIIDIHYNNQYSFINKFTRYIFNESDIKQIIELIKKLIEENISYCSVESITFKLPDYGQLPAINYIFSCRIKLDKKYFYRDIKDINYKEYKTYRKLENNFNVYEFSDCFYCINKYFDFYLSNIFGHCEYLPETIDSIIDHGYNFSKYKVNPIQYMKNIILFKKFISKQQDREYFNLMKLGFIFYRSIEIKEEN